MPDQKSNLVKVYFMNGISAIFQREKVVFMLDGSLFMLSSDMLPTYCVEKNDSMIAIVNWRAVSWVREHEEVLD